MTLTQSQLNRLIKYQSFIEIEFNIFGYHKHSGISYDELTLIETIIKSKKYSIYDKENLNRIEKWFNKNSCSITKVV